MQLIPAIDLKNDDGGFSLAWQCGWRVCGTKTARSWVEVNVVAEDADA